MSCLLAEMTAPQVAEAVTSGLTTVILPLGSTEQHGPHLPLATDSIRATALADGLAAALPGTLVAPVLPVGCSDEHTGFPGLISLDHETLARVIVDCGRRLAGWGVRQLVLLSAHGGNTAAIEIARTRLRDQVPGLQVRVLGGSPAMSQTLAEIAATDGITPEAVGLHAGEGETSEMLHIHPDLVRMDRAAAGYTGPMPAVMPQLRRVGLRGVTASGTLGDPRAACARRGADYLATQIESFRRMLAEEADL